MSDYNIYESGNFAGYKINESEVARLCRNVAENLGKLEYELNKDNNHTLVWGNYCLFASVKTCPNASDVNYPKLTITISNTLAEVPKGNGFTIYGLLSTNQMEPYRTQITVGIKRGPAAIAKEINSRLWDDYLKLYQLAMSQYRINRADEEKRLELTRSLAAIIDARPHGNKISESVNVGTKHDIGLDAEINDYIHTLKLTNVPPELMADIFRAIASHMTESYYEKWVRETKEKVLREHNKALQILDTDRELFELPAIDYNWHSAFDKRLKDSDIYQGFAEAMILEYACQLAA